MATHEHRRRFEWAGDACRWPCAAALVRAGCTAARCNWHTPTVPGAAGLAGIYLHRRLPDQARRFHVLGLPPVDGTAAAAVYTVHIVLASHAHAHGRLRPPTAAYWHNPPLSTPALASPAARYAPSDMHSPAAPGCGAARPNSAATLMLLSVILIVNVPSTTVHAPIPLSQEACSAPTTASHVAHSSSQPCVRRRSPAAAQVHAALCYSEATRLENRVVRWGCGRARSGQLAPQISAITDLQLERAARALL